MTRVTRPLRSSQVKRGARPSMRVGRSQRQLSHLTAENVLRTCGLLPCTDSLLRAFWCLKTLEQTMLLNKLQPPHSSLWEVNSTKQSVMSTRDNIHSPNLCSRFVTGVIQRRPVPHCQTARQRIHAIMVIIHTQRQTWKLFLKNKNTTEEKPMTDGNNS